MTGRYAFKMFLNPGCAEHRRRHDVICPELVCLLTEAGVANYIIRFISIRKPRSCSPFWSAVRTIGWKHLPDQPVMRRWWGSHEGHHAHASRRLTGLDPAH
jgi:L-rhamnose mutarotase